MGVGRFPGQLRGAAVIALANVGLDPARHVEVHLGAGVLQLVVTGGAVGVYIDHRCVSHWA
jgi:hypothetical protein